MTVMGGGQGQQGGNKARRRNAAPYKTETETKSMLH